MSSAAPPDEGFWLFGYGSLIWNPSVPHVERLPARLPGFSRRFWQGSHDHRGLPHAPGRVVTLIEDADSVCTGMAFRVPAHAAVDVLHALDHREKNGYSRQRHGLVADSGEHLDALVYIAEPGNFAWLGPAPVEEVARQIATSVGPSGSNRDYLQQLAQALRNLGTHDEHVFELEAMLQQFVER
ncbi:MAG: gamma-glutamylcyclotransferase [Gammaproteobacteria bacterium]|nr:gamma-glutamylcyclotransferase [Gammaproteobacteria bacterium]